MTRRGFFGRVGAALAAVVVAPRALFSREAPVTLDLRDTDYYRYRLTYVSAHGETPVSSAAAPSARVYRQNPDGSLTHLPHGIDDGRGLS